ncbi:insulinase family protein [Congregibacter litoralis]|uniref:Protease 3 n=1 Tax=Congregibacter litoralis KT71 TaxID=314285 RepID=A4A5N8_9GAMM|nr:insulinase family protein [Congregibacter litoralis]EAQ98335.1 Secreted/periplasmic Zn-dependent peptidase, insulinase-like protein [Congregibacter litoralis KT71]
MQIRITARRAVQASLYALFGLLVACANPDMASPSAKKPAPDAPVQSPNDRFAYRLITLDNGLKILLISNPDTPKAAASLDVQVGSGDNPDGRGGLAHFLEHMLFLGTEKYPDAAEYVQFVTEHGGSRNAYTSFEHTNYFFDIDADHLPGALDRFAQFFISPSFDTAYVDRERNAVQAEYQMGLKSDGRRGLDVFQASMNPAHPLSQFAVGSLDSLADRPDAKVRDDLLQFYDDHYSADIMRLVILGREPLDALEDMAAKMFSAVPNRGVELETIKEPLFVDAQLPMLVKIKPQGTLRQLEVNFQIPDYRGNYTVKPMTYVSNLIGHEGEGSLLSLLKREGLADALSSGTGLSWRGGELLSVTINLTEKGVEEYERVLQNVFAYLDLLRSEEPREWLYQEQAAVAALGFRFREPSAPMGYVSRLSNAMHYYDDPDVLQGPYLMSDFDAAMISDALQWLMPDKAQVVLTAPEVSTDRTSRFYEVPYSKLGPEALMLSRWEGSDIEGLHLPEPNPFIAENVELVALTDDNPRLPDLRVEEPRKRLWFKQSEDFRVPKGAMYVSFRSPLVAATAEQKAASALYTRMVKDAVREYTYPALLAGLGFNFYTHGQGISMRVSGYNNKQLALLEDLLAKIADQTFDPARFERLRRELVLGLQNTVARRPTSQLLDDLRRALGNGAYDEQELIDALEAMDVEGLEAYRKEFWASVKAEGMLYGNYAPPEVQKMSEVLDAVLGEGEGAPALAPEVLQLVEGEPLELHAAIEHDDAVVAWYLQGDGQAWRDRALVALTGQITESGFFQQLRTEQQLGYIVSSFYWPQHDVPGLMLLVQSPSHSAGHVVGAMEQFLSDTLRDITEEQFQRHKQALINATLKPQENLGERAEFYWQSIASREWSFDAPQQMAAAVESLSFDEWQEAYRDLFLENRRSLLALSVGAKAAPEIEGNAVFDNPEALKKGRDRITVDLSPL